MLQPTLEGYDKLLAVLAQVPSRIQAGVKIVPPGSGYAYVWEYGSARIKKPGPKTMWSTNPLGQRAILTIQAPQGWVRVNRQRYEAILKDKVSKINWSQVGPNGWRDALQNAANEAAEESAVVMQETAPVDSGQLRSDIHPVAGGDPILEESDGELELSI